MGILGQVWYLIVSIPDLCTITYFCICIDVAFMGNQLLSQLLMEQFDTFPIQYRHVEHMHEGVWLEKDKF